VPLEAHIEETIMSNGYWGKALFVDLSTGHTEVRTLPEAVYRRYLGGYGLGIRLLYEQVPAGADPLAPENAIAFLPGLLTGSGAPFSGRFMVAAKSPLTGGWGDANCGGNLGPAVRGAGYDALVVRGVAAQPVYLYMDPEQVELRDARELWGLDASATEEAIGQLAGSGVRVACIGPAGEKQSLISGIVNDHGRIAARCGLGAVMGAKNLKAVAAHGKQSLPLADEAAFRTSTKGYRDLFRRRPASWTPLVHKLLHLVAPLLARLGIAPTGGPLQMVIDNYRLYGTTAGTALLVALDDAPIRNWTGSSSRHYPLSMGENLSDEAVIQDNIRPYACHSCPVACGASIRLPDGGTGYRPEYETLAAFGPLLLNGDLDTVVACNEICNLAGLDSISTGVAVAFALECAEHGWLPADCASEMTLAWGDGEAIVELTRRIADRRPGLGDWLADGVQRAALQLGPEAQAAAMHAGGQELPMHRSLHSPGVGVGYLVDPAPGRHTSSDAGIADNPTMMRFLAAEGRKLADRYDLTGKGAEMAVTMAVLRAFDSLGLCQFCLLMGEPPFVEWLRAATGWDVDDQELLTTGRRIQALRHGFNARDGISPRQVTLPGRERGDPPLQAGPLAGIELDTAAMREAYFATMGVDSETGWPLPETAKALDLGLVPGYASQ
jgi:aldehyde:ferredoxin oxidoreductase